MENKTVVINDVEWTLRPINCWDLRYADDLGYKVSDWAWQHAKYEARRTDTNESHWVSYFYKKDIKEIMEGLKK